MSVKIVSERLLCVYVCAMRVYACLARPFVYEKTRDGGRSGLNQVRR